MVLLLVLDLEMCIGLAQYLVDVRGHWVGAFKRAFIDMRLLRDYIRSLWILIRLTVVNEERGRCSCTGHGGLWRQRALRFNVDRSILGRQAIVAY